MQVANDKSLASESYTLVERGEEKKMVRFEDLLTEILRGWQTAVSHLCVSDDIEGTGLREPTESESKIISWVMRKHCRREDL